MVIYLGELLLCGRRIFPGDGKVSVFHKKNSKFFKNFDRLCKSIIRLIFVVYDN